MKRIFPGRLTPKLAVVLDYVIAIRNSHSDQAKIFGRKGLIW